MADGEQMSDHFLDGCADLFSGKERAVRCAGLLYAGMSEKVRLSI